MWRAIRDNPRAVSYAVLMHLVLLALLMIGLDWTPKATAPGTNKPIQAELVEKDPLKVIEQRRLEEQRKLEAAAERKRKAELEARQQAEAEAQRKAEQAAKEKAALEVKQKAALEAKQKAEAATKKKAAAAAEKKRKAAQAKAKAEAQQKAEAEAARKREAAVRAEAEAALQEQLRAEQELARAKSALAEFIPYIQDKVQRNWLRPPGSPQGLACLVKVRLIPGGEVASVNVIRSSGDPVFDRSVELAVLKASPLPLPNDAALFNHFREINFNFDPGR